MYLYTSELIATVLVLEMFAMRPAFIADTVSKK